MIQPRKLPPLPALRAFEAAARHLSFRLAAEELAVTPTAISHQIRLLEGLLGLALFRRHVRRVSLTEAGAHLYPVLRAGLDSFAQAIAGLYPPPRPGPVTVTATTLFTASRLIPALGAFRAAWPQYELRLHATDDVVDLAGGAADIAIRYAPGPFPGLVSQRLCRERFGPVCSPSLGLSRPRQLSDSVLIHSEWRRRDMQPDWPRWRAAAAMASLDVTGGLRFTDESHAIQAAIAGHGVAIASLVLVADELARGVLVHPFGPVIEGHAYHLVAPAEVMARADVQAVCGWLKTSIATQRPG